MLTVYSHATPWHLEMPHGPLIGILPYGQLDLEQVQPHGTERGHIGAIGSTQDKQIVFAFKMVAEGQSESVMPTRPTLTAVSHRHWGRFEGRYP